VEVVAVERMEMETREEEQTGQMEIQVQADLQEVDQVDQVE
jgi:hypothetical protein